MRRFAFRRPGGLIALAGTAAVSAALIGAQAPATQPTPVEQATAQIVTALLERGHISKPTINDEIAARWAKNFVESLDPLEVQLPEAAMSTSSWRKPTTLDDKVKEGDIAFAKKVFDRYLKRSDERLAKAIGDLAAEAGLHDRRVDR